MNLGESFVNSVEDNLRVAIQEQGYSVKEFTLLDYDVEDDAWWGLFLNEENTSFCFHAEVSTGMLGVELAND